MYSNVKNKEKQEILTTEGLWRSFSSNMCVMEKTRTKRLLLYTEVSSFIPLNCYIFYYATELEQTWREIENKKDLFTMILEHHTHLNSLFGSIHEQLNRLWQFKYQKQAWNWIESEFIPIFFLTIMEQIHFLSAFIILPFDSILHNMNRSTVWNTQAEYQVVTMQAKYRLYTLNMLCCEAAVTAHACVSLE